MGTVKKIICYIMAFTAVFALCAIGGFADSVETDEEIEIYPTNIHFTQYANNNFDSNYSYIYNISNNYSNWVRTRDFSNITLPDSSATFPTPSVYPWFFYSFKFKESSESSVNLKLENSYTYIATFTIRFYVRQSFINDNGEVLPVSLEDIYYGLYIDDDFGTWWQDGSTYRLDFLAFRQIYSNMVPYSDAFLASMSIDADSIYGESSDVSGCYSFVIPVSFVFRVPDDYFETTDNYGVIGCSFGFDALPFDMDYITRNFSVRLIGVSAYYDPDATIVTDPEDEINDIVQGQKDAVDYGLDKEEQANQDAYDEAVDGMDDAHNLFNPTSYSTPFVTLLDSINYTGTDFHFYFPALSFPFLENVTTQEQEIPLKYWIDQVPGVVILGLRVLGYIGLVFTIIHWVRKYISLFAGGDK